MDNITNVDELLRREAALSSQLIGNGLTAIRKYDFTTTGVFYSGMFSVCIGIERILKLILLLDYKISNGKYPENNYLKNKGHKIDRLISDCKIINDKLCNYSSLQKSEIFFGDSLITTIVAYLTEFSISSRYYNLDVITGNTKTNNEPLAQWTNDICKVIIDRHPPSKKKLAEFKEYADAHSDESIVMHTHEDGSHIGDLHNFVNHSALIEEKQSYSVYYIYQIVNFSLQLLTELDYMLNPQLYLREYFNNLLMYKTTCSEIRRRKNWCRV